MDQATRRELNQAWFERLEVDVDDDAALQVTQIYRTEAPAALVERASSLSIGGTVTNERRRRSLGSDGVASNEGLNFSLLVVLTGQSSKFFEQVRRLVAALPLLGDLAAPSNPARQQQTRLTPELVAELVASYEAGTDMNALARAYGVHRHSVRAHLTKAGVELRRQGLTNIQIDEVVRLYAAGYSLAKLGQQFNCDHTTIGRALKRRGLKLRTPWESIS